MVEMYRALVVDDDPIARKTVRFALEQESFRCDLASDGDEAMGYLNHNEYELVVTDLRMPNKHGHALSVELLKQDPRPFIVVHSSVDDPRITRDLIARGVDDIIYKPTNYAAFAAKVRGLVMRRQRQHSAAPTQASCQVSPGIEESTTAAASSTSTDPSTGSTADVAAASAGGTPSGEPPTPANSSSAAMSDVTATGAATARATAQGATATGATARGATATGATAQGATATGATAQGTTATGATAQGATATGATATGATATGAAAAGASITDLEDLRVTAADIESKIAVVSKIVPLSQVALDVFNLTRTESDASMLGSKIQQDASLATEVLSIANSSFYNPSKNAITELNHAVVRIGQRRIGELALAAATLSTMTQRNVSWMSMQTVWQQSMAAGVAIEHLVRQGNHSKIRDNLVLTAIMSSLGRIVLATLYPEHYQQLVKNCAATGDALIEQENRVFPENHARTMMRLQAIWNIPREICKPMNNILDPYQSLESLPEPARTRVELLKVAIFVGKFANRAWHSWDLVDVPPLSVLKRLQIEDLTQIISDTSADTAAIVKFRDEAQSTPAKEGGSRVATAAARTLHYENVSHQPFDFVGHFIHQLKLKMLRMPSDPDARVTTLVINAIGWRKHMRPPNHSADRAGKVILIVDCDETPDWGDHCEVIKLPASYAKLTGALLMAASD